MGRGEGEGERIHIDTFDQIKEDGENSNLSSCDSTPGSSYFKVHITKCILDSLYARRGKSVVNEISKQQ